MDSIGFLTETFAPLAGKRLLDVGCGGGYLARTLTARGAAITGVDPGEAAIDMARIVAPAAAFESARAEALPFADGAFDGTIFLNSLHHVPTAGMRAALREAARATARDGFVVVIEPLAEGSFFAAFRPIEDETAVRREAQEVLAAALAEGTFREVRSLVFVRRELFDSFDTFVERASAAEPARRAVIERDRAAIEAAFEAAAHPDEAGRRALDQPLRGVVLQASA